MHVTSVCVTAIHVTAGHVAAVHLARIHVPVVRIALVHVLLPVATVVVGVVRIRRGGVRAIGRDGVVVAGMGARGNGKTADPAGQGDGQGTTRIR